ncbi:hypothetical protein AnigIFM60653_008480 [Aspergillus niger]|nr:hypothetical protein AnigIFM60653_008480 [Aspergillus niger]
MAKKATDFQITATVKEICVDADEALTMVGVGEVLSLNAVEEATLVRKIDWHIMPLINMGFRTDLHLHGDEYEWLGSLFYLGYLVSEIPTSRLLQRMPVAQYSAPNVVLWRGVLSCTAACRNFDGAVAVRSLLGVFEAAVTPGFALLASQWYTQAEQAARIGICFGFNGIAQIVGGVIATGIAHATEAALPSWKM